MSIKKPPLSRRLRSYIIAVYQSGFPENVGAAIGRPWILPVQNPSPSGEYTWIFLSENHKNHSDFWRTSNARPYDPIVVTPR